MCYAKEEHSYVEMLIFDRLNREMELIKLTLLIENIYTCKQQEKNILFSIAHETLKEIIIYVKP